MHPLFPSAHRVEEYAFMASIGTARTASPLENRPQRNPAWIWLAYGVVGTALLVTTLEKFFRGPDQWHGVWFDDFFYYLVIAREWLAHGALTFDGSTPTNGFHPLWMAVIVVLLKLFGDTIAFFVALSLLIALLSFASFHYAWRITTQLIGHRGWALPIALASVAYSFMISRSGMEVALAIPLLLALATHLLDRRPGLPSDAEALAVGLLASLAVLSRLDSALYVIALLPAWLYAWQGSIARRMRSLALSALGGILVPIYGAANLIWFHALLPVSGNAKSLRLERVPDHFPTLTGLGSLQATFCFYPILGLVCLAAIYLLLRPASLPGPARATALGALCVAPIFYLVQAALGDWPLWFWYLYPLAIGLPIALAVLLRPLLPLVRRHDAMVARRAAYALPVLLVLAIVGEASRLTASATSHPIYAAAQRLAAFAALHPGRYAMGDRAGTFAYLWPGPVFQLEGLVEDRTLLSEIVAHSDLNDVLREHAIDYYVSPAQRASDGCYTTLEPLMGGPQSPKMAGRFCIAPSLVLDDVPDDWETPMVFHVSASSGR
jgi:hypothetical protein